MRVGVAVGSNDVDMIPFLQQLKWDRILGYVELYVQPTVTVADIVKWQKSGLVGICHAPHGDRAEFIPAYMDIGVQTANMFGASYVVFDPGHTVSPKIHNLPAYCIPENMPDRTSFGDRGVWSTPEEVAGDFCLDFAHAWISARHKRIDPREYIRQFMALRPVHFHLTDVSGDRDHVPLGLGDIHLGFIVGQINETGRQRKITIETDHQLPNRRETIRDDLLLFNKLLLCESGR